MHTHHVYPLKHINRDTPTASTILLALPFFLALFFFVALTATPAQGQTYQVIYNFGADGEYPNGLTVDQAGNLYGATVYGNVFKLSKDDSGSWVITTLYTFQGGSDGVLPLGGVIFGPDGSLYGTTSQGGNEGCFGAGCGTIFRLTPATTPCTVGPCPWTETVLYRFAGTLDGCGPDAPLVLQNGNIYGTTQRCGAGQYGTVFELTNSGRGWILNTIHSFSGGEDGIGPSGGLIADVYGHLYGVTTRGGNAGVGTVYSMVASQSGWTETILYTFHPQTEGACPTGGLMFDRFGDLYGTTSAQGLGNEGTVFELVPDGDSWAFTLLRSLFWRFPKPGGGGGCRGAGSATNLVTDDSGNLYGTTASGGLYQDGSIFKLTPSDDGWTYSLIRDLSFGDGMAPWSRLVVGPDGGIFGTTIYGGVSGAGVVFEITP